MAESGQQNGDPAPEERTAIFHYIKSNYFRVVFAEGVIGSPSQSGDGVRISFFNSRTPLPLQVHNRLDKDGRIGEEISVIGRPGVVREVEVEVVLNIDAAKVVRDWLATRIDEAEKVAAKIAEIEAGGPK